MTIQDKIACSPAGAVFAGGICAHTNFDETFNLDFNQFIDFLEPQEAHDGLAEKGAAVCFSSLDTQKIVTELKVACRLLKSKCSYETKKLIASMQAEKALLDRTTMAKLKATRLMENRTAFLRIP